MALLDIVFSEGDKQNIILEIPQGTLNDPLDILSECCSSSGLMMSDLILTSGGGATSFAF